MTLVELDEYFRSFLKMDDFYGDPSQNGIQVQNGNPCEKQINKVAFAVDACQETISKAAKEGAGLLFVHHGRGHSFNLIAVFRNTCWMGLRCSAVQNACGGRYQMHARLLSSAVVDGATRRPVLPYRRRG